MIIIYGYCPSLMTQNNQTKMRIMRMLSLLNVAKSEVYLQEYKLSPTRDLVLLKWIISTMLEKKNGGLMLLAHEGELCGRELDPQCFSSNGPFSRSTTCTTHYSPKKKEQPNGPKVYMKWKKLDRAAQIQKL